MRKTVPEEVRQLLLRRGLPPVYSRRVVAELEDHWLELRTSAVQEGLSNAAAEEAANEKLGDSLQLARSLADCLRTASWWGRHPVLGFGAGPLVTLILWWTGGLLLGGWASGAIPLGTFTVTREPDWSVLDVWLEGIRIGGYILLPVLFCVVARRYYCGYSWAILGCLVLAMHNWFHFVQLTRPAGDFHAGMVWGYTFTSQASSAQWAALAGPALALLLFYFAQVRATRRLNPKL